MSVLVILEARGYLPLRVMDLPIPLIVLETPPSTGNSATPITDSPFTILRQVIVLEYLLYLLSSQVLTRTPRFFSNTELMFQSQRISNNICIQVISNGLIVHRGSFGVLGVATCASSEEIQVVPNHYKA